MPIIFLNGRTRLYFSPLVRLVNKSCKTRIALNRKPVSDTYSLVKPGQLQCYKILFFIVEFFWICKLFGCSFWSVLLCIYAVIVSMKYAEVSLGPVLEVTIPYFRSGNWTDAWSQNVCLSASPHALFLHSVQIQDWSWDTCSSSESLSV